MIDICQEFPKMLIIILKVLRNSLQCLCSWSNFQELLRYVYHNPENCQEFQGIYMIMIKKTFEIPCKFDHDEKKRENILVFAIISINSTRRHCVFFLRYCSSEIIWLVSPIENKCCSAYLYPVVKWRFVFLKALHVELQKVRRNCDGHISKNAFCSVFWNWGAWKMRKFMKMWSTCSKTCYLLTFFFFTKKNTKNANFLWHKEFLF